MGTGGLELTMTITELNEFVEHPEVFVIVNEYVPDDLATSVF